MGKALLLRREKGGGLRGSKGARGACLQLGYLCGGVQEEGCLSLANLRRTFRWLLSLPTPSTDTSPTVHPPTDPPPPL
jgi:hypothetical protein